MLNINNLIGSLICTVLSLILYSGNVAAYHGSGGGETGEVQYILVSLSVLIIVFYAWLKFR